MNRKIIAFNRIFGIFCYVPVFLLLLLPILSCKTPPTAPPQKIRCEEPVFSIVSITILQAELINTRLKVRLKIDNPNEFPLELSSFNYELYGAGRFWADGSISRAFSIAAKDSVEKDLFIVMNFTNMRRDVLDNIINMTQVQYRLSGSVEISPLHENLPIFTQNFRLQGESAVDR